MSARPYTPYGVQQTAAQSQEPQPNGGTEQYQFGPVAPQQVEQPTQQSLPQQLSAAHASVVDQITQSFTQSLQQELAQQQQNLIQSQTGGPSIDLPGKQTMPQQSAMDAAQAQVAQFLQSVGHTPQSFFGEQSTQQGNNAF